MWGQIYPHVVLLIFANTIFKVSCKGKGSLTFLIDETLSMSRDIKQVLDSVDIITNIVKNEKSSLIDDMVLVTFNDPGIHDRVVTRDPEEFKKALNLIEAHNEANKSEQDCWEPSMKGLLQALNKSKTDSYIFVFTDASAKDYMDSRYVIEICQKKQTQIVFVLTGRLCRSKHYVPEALGVYFDIAVACSGLAIFVQKEEVDQVFGPIKEIIKGNKTVITSAIVPAGDSKNIPFAIDDHTDYVIVSATGTDVTLKINETSVSVEEIMSTDNAIVLKLSNIKPGNYVATVKGNTNTSVVIVGRTDFFFTHGFSELKPKSLSDTSPQPKSDAKGYLSVSVTDDNHSVRIEAAKILDMDGKPIIENLPLTEISKDFYITDPFVAPSQRFKVAVEGIDKTTNKPIIRTAKIPITPPPPKIAPKVQGVDVMRVNQGKTAVFKCKVVSGSPKPIITWQFWGESGSMQSLAGSESVLRITNVNNKHEGKYKCVADNGAGIDEHVTTLFVQDMPKILSSDSNIYNSTEGDALLRIPCIATGLPKPSITWKLNDLVIGPSAKYFIENGTLIITDPKVSDTNSYTCEAKNDVGAVSVTFRTSISQAPQLSGVTDKKVRIGTPATIECTVVKGFPPPKITWQFRGESDSKFTHLAGSESVLRITNVNNKHEGKYKCMADNGAGIDEHVTTLFVQEMPEILSSDSNIYNSTEGDAFLRIPCVATGLPKPSITWKLNDLVIDPSAKYFIENGTLIITDPKVSDTNSYTCEAKNDVGAVSVTFRTSISQPPQLSGVTDKKVRIGTPATIECAVVRGFPPPKITWQFRGESDSKFTHLAGSESVLRITNVNNKHEGKYKCVADNGAGIDEHVTTLFVQEMPEILSSDSNIYNSTEGDAFLRIPCVATGLPKPSITWKLNDLVIDPSAKYFIENGTLIITDPKVSDTNSYTCEAKNDVGAVSVTFRTSISQAPQLSGVTDKKVRIGTPATIECTVVKGFPPPKITWQFRGESDSKFTHLAGSESVLRITNVNNKHEGKYKCMADNGAGIDEHVTTLFVQEMPEILSSDSNIYNSTEGDAFLRIPCVATGLPKPSITWKLNDLVIDPSAKYFIENGTLIITDPKVSDTNSYTCEAKNDVGAVSVTFRTSISQPPQLSGVTDKKVRIGTPATIECAVVRGFPPPKITWQFRGESDSKFTHLAGSESVLRITNVNNKHEGKYKCVADNGAGIDEHVTTLFVQEMPEILSSDSNIYNSTEGDAFLRIPCVATGLPKPSITWKLNDLVIDPSAKYFIENGTLIITDPKVSDTNSYTCEAKNDVGAVSVTFRTSISQAPQLSGVTDKKVRIGTPATIECTVVKGFPPPKITWQFRGESDSKFTHLAGSESVLRITNVNNKHEGKYKCMADNGAGIDEHVTTLFVQEMPEILSSDSNIYNSTEGDAFLRIPCVATGLPKPSITWKLNDLVIDPSAKYFIENGTLIITDPKVSDTNSYTCEAKNDVGAVSVTHRTSISQAPQISGVTDKKVRIRTPANIECKVVKGEPKPTITWKFMANSGSEFMLIPGSFKVLNISKEVENKHAGRYKCVATNKIGSDEHVTTLIVESLPGITTKSTTVEGVEGDLALRIPCEVVGIPQPVVTWKLNGTKITPDGKYSIEDGALVIVTPAKNDSSWYTCEAKNNVGSVSTAFQAAVEKHPRTFGTKHHVYILKGETKKLKCDAFSSESQTVKWFEAKAKQKDSSLSTTTPLPKLKSSETTTPSSQGYFSSTMSPTFTLNEAIKEPYIQIVNASDLDDGSYTCRVSDKHGNTHTHTYVVDVGSAPEFLPDANLLLSDWEGEISYITQNCDTKASLHPKPVVKWTYNGEVFTDFNLAGVGHYTCTVSNGHGSVQRTFDVKSSVCLISRNLKDAQYMPLVLNDKGFWHKLKTTNHYTVVKQKDKITLSCPSQKYTSNTFKNFPKKNTLEALCYKEDSFVVEDTIYKLSDLQCTNRIQPSVIRKKVKCLTETSELLRVGYNVSGFLEAYEVCFDTEKYMPLYTRIIMTYTDNNGLSAGYNWYTYPGIGYEKTEKGFSCKDTTSSCCYSKSQLVNAKDFNDSPAKRSTFIDPLNVIPFWLPCNTTKPTWETVNDNVKAMLPTYNEIVTWSGTHTFQEINGVIIPRYLWKVVWYNDKDVVAIVHVNDPSPTEKDIKCKDICSAYSEWIVFNDKYTYCCSQSEFFGAFNIHFDIGETLDAALKKMKRKSD